MIGCLQLSSPGDDALHALRLRLDRLSPRVQLIRTGGEVALLADLGRGRLPDGHRHAVELSLIAPASNAQIGVAPSPTLAALAARRARADTPLVVGPAAVPALLARCPVSWLAPLAPLSPVLHGLGLRSLADVVALPAAAIEVRFGRAALQAWRALHGDEPPLTPVPHPPRLGARRHFDGPVADQAILTLAISRLAAQLGAALERRGVQARALALHLQGDTGLRSASCVLERPAATRAALTPIAAGLLDAADVASGVETLTLLAGELVPTRGEQLPLFAPVTEQREGGRAALADLAARLAPGSVLRPATTAPGAALPEARNHLLPWGAR
jgi:protein ImuB